MATEKSGFEIIYSKTTGQILMDLHEIHQCDMRANDAERIIYFTILLVATAAEGKTLKNT